ncbi:MAG: hypothetical protein IT368_15565 [Candidatus Hydrogenedentes bacterium]|nr:hypothetical protein [Candidatus Hydrogenedentota bacterium]
MIRMPMLQMVLLVLPFFAAAEPAAVPPAVGHHLGYVVVSPDGPDDGGDFGPRTPGTKTAGLQEAINHARELRRAVYVVGGGAKKAFENPVVYTMTETLRIPWTQDFKLDGGNAVIQFNGTGDAIVFDSQMSSWFKFGLVVSAAEGAVVRMRPESKGPDNFSVITACKFEFAALVGSGSVFGGEGTRGRGTGLWLDATNGPIDGNEFLVSEVVACDTGIRLDEGATNNWIRCPFLHLCNTHLVLGEAGGTRARLNRIDAFIDGANGLPSNTGATIHGQNNLLTLSFGRNAPGRNLVLAPGAVDNNCTLINLPDGLTDESGGSNRIVAPGR